MSKDEKNSEDPMKSVKSHDWNAERLTQLKQLMPDLFTNEGKLSSKALQKLIDPKSVNEVERYEFRWFGKSQAKREAFTPTDATLVYDEARSVNPSQSDNLIIEGENLAVLKLLSTSYREQVKCIYIDPPYNTGKDFVYSDKFNQDKAEYWEEAEITENGYKIDSNSETDGRFHSNWLNMMYSRLLIARQLLREDGVIFISIDDNEVHHLRKLCDEVFGEENFFADLVVVRAEGGGLAKKIIKGHDNLLVYSKSIDTFSGLHKPRDIRGKIVIHDNIKYWIEEDWLRKEFGKYGTLLYEDIESIKGKRKKYEIDLGLKNGLYRLIKKGNKHIVGRLREVEKDSSKFYSVLKHLNKNGISSLESVQMEEYFDYPKPISLVKEIVLGSTFFSKKDNDIILDFFGGSGTTGQAITELNQEDGGNRQYILVQLPEKTDEKSEAFKAGYKKISDITIERNKRVVENIIKQKKEATPDLFSQQESEKMQTKGLGFKVFKLQKSNFPRVEFAPDPEKSDEENIVLLNAYIQEKEAQLSTLFNDDELITEILIKHGFKLNYTVSKQEALSHNNVLIASDGEKETLICIDSTLHNETVEHFKKYSDQKLIVLERALDSTKKWNLKHAMAENFTAF